MSASVVATCITEQKNYPFIDFPPFTYPVSKEWSSWLAPQYEQGLSQRDHPNCFSTSTMRIRMCRSYTKGNRIRVKALISVIMPAGPITDLLSAPGR